MNTGWRMISRSGRPPPLPAALGGSGGNWMPAITAIETSATTASER